MDKYNDQFTPENVDEEIAQFLSTQHYAPHATSSKARVVHDLKQVYDNDTALERTWQRYASQLQAWDVPVDEQQPGSLNSGTHWNAVVARQHSLSTQPARRPHLKAVLRHNLGILAACILALFIVGSMLTIIPLMRGASTQTASQPARFIDGNMTPVIASPADLNNPTPSGIYRGGGNTIARMDNQGKIQWQIQLPFNVDADTTLTTHNTMFVESYDGIIQAYDATSGDLRWQYDLHRYMAVKRADKGLLVVDNALYLTDEHNVFALDIASGHLLHTFTFPTQNSQRNTLKNLEFTVANHILYVANANMLYAVNIADSTQSWNVQLSSNTDLQPTTPQIIGNMLCLTTYDETHQSNYVYGISPSNGFSGKKIWQSLPLPGGPISSTIAANGKLYFAQSGGSLYAYDPQTGSQAWKQNALTFSGGHLTASGNTLYAEYMLQPEVKGISNLPQGIAALNTDSGQVKWTFTGNIQGSNSIQEINLLGVSNGLIYTTTTLLSTSEQNPALVVLDANGKTTWNSDFTATHYPAIDVL